MNNYDKVNEHIIDKPIFSNNQLNSNQNHIENLKYALKSESKLVCCPFCKCQDFTITESGCSTINLLFCIFSIGLCWIIYKCIRGKDYNCYNVKHTCSRCGQTLSDYKAC